MLRKLIDIINDKTSTLQSVVKSVTLLDSLHTQREAWSRVTTATIVNCFRKAGFCTALTALEEDDSAHLSLVHADLSVHISRDDFDAYIDIDHDITTRGDETDQQISASGHSESSSHLSSLATYHDALGAIRILLAYFEANGFSTDNFDETYEICTSNHVLLYESGPSLYHTLSVGVC